MHADGGRSHTSSSSGSSANNGTLIARVETHRYLLTMEAGVEEPTTRAVDLEPNSRPGIPMESEPAPAEGAHWDAPPQQAGTEGHLHRVELEGPTPVVGTAQPPHGVSGLLRKQAYRIPEHHARHWMLLLAADRIDAVEDRLGGLLADPLDRAGMHTSAERVRRNPLPIMAGVAVGAWLARRMVR
jgi:hypothetical protein